MLRNEILEFLNLKNENSNLNQMILDKLEFFSYEIKESDLNMIALCIEKVTCQIEIDCNIDTIPAKYDVLVCDAVIGEFFTIKKSLNQLDIASIDLSTAVASVSMGGTSVSYNQNDADSVKLDNVINALISEIKGVYPCLRKIHW